jgi:hypothetical protein
MAPEFHSHTNRHIFHPTERYWFLDRKTAMLIIGLWTDKNTNQQLLPKQFPVEISSTDFEIHEDDLAVAFCRHAAYS